MAQRILAEELLATPDDRNGIVHAHIDPLSIVETAQVIGMVNSMLCDTVDGLAARFHARADVEAFMRGILLELDFTTGIVGDNFGESLGEVGGAR